MILNDEQQRWCAKRGLGKGYDDDDPNLVQFSHIVEATGEHRPYIDAPGTFEVEAALCRSPRFWFGQGPGHVWPAVDVEKAYYAWGSGQSPDQIARWSEITCPKCAEMLFERGLPGSANSGPRVITCEFAVSAVQQSDGGRRVRIDGTNDDGDELIFYLEADEARSLAIDLTSAAEACHER